MGYEELTPDDLATLYLKDSEDPEERRLIEERRKLIEQHVAGLSEYQQGYFRHLVHHEPLPFEKFEGHNISCEEKENGDRLADPLGDGAIIWSDLYSLNDLKWDYMRRCEDSRLFNPAHNLTLFVEGELSNAAIKLSQLKEGYIKAKGRKAQFLYSSHIQVYNDYISFLNNALTNGSGVSVEDGKGQSLNVDSEPNSGFAASATVKPRSKKLEENLFRYGFQTFLLEKKGVQDEQINGLLGKLANGDTPYRIALLHELGYIDYFKKEYCKTSALRDAKLADILGSEARRVKGNILVLIPGSSENRKKYTSHEHIESVREMLLNYK